MITDLTVGHPKKTLWRFTLPMFIGVMFQQLYNIVNNNIAGRPVGEDALTVVGAFYPTTVVSMVSAVGNNSGVSVAVSGLSGVKDIGRMKTAAHTAFIAYGVMSLILIVLGYAFCGDMIRVIRTPDNIFVEGELYLKIYVYGLTFLLLYDVCTGIFTTLGDSRTSLCFLVGSSLGNIVLDYWLVARLGLGVAGVAWATFTAQGGSTILALGTLPRRLGVLEIDRKSVLFSAALLEQIAAIAVPSIMQQSVLSVGNMFVQEIVNRYGSAVTAGCSGAIRLNTLAINTFMSLGGCSSSYTAQNLGTGKKERTPLGSKTGVRLSFYAVVPFFLLYFMFSRQMMGLFLGAGNTRAIQSGMESLRIVNPIYFMIPIKLMTDGIIRGFGAMTYFVLATVLDLIFRVIVTNILTRRFVSMGIWMAWPFGWIAAALLTVIFYRRIVMGRYRIHI